jgi:hypothetical protein
MDDSTRLSREAHARAQDFFAANPACTILIERKTQTQTQPPPKPQPERREMP